jgi:hypothetical protein
MGLGGRMLDRALVWLGLVAWAAVLALTTLCLALRVAASGPPLGNRFGMTDAGLLGFGVLQMACVSAAVLIVARIPRNLVAWLLFGIGLSYAVATAAAAWVFDAGTRPGTAGLAEIAWLNQTAGLIPGVLTALLILAYPRLPRGGRSITLLVGSATAFTLLGVGIPAFHPGPLWFWETIENPFGVGPRLAQDLGVGLALQPAVLTIGLVICGAWIAWRYRHSESLERLQLKWFASAALLSLVALGFVGVGGVLGRGSDTGWWSLLVYAIAGSAVPISICIAILRYNLYAIDRLVNRAMVYTAVTVVLATVYLALVTTLGAIARSALSGATDGETIVVAISTLIVAALFDPVRRRMQRAVDRRFDRARYDAALTVDAFSHRLRETVELAAVERETIEVVHRTLRPVTVGIWLGRGS